VIHTFTIAKPELWWPVGLGQPHLYKLHVSMAGQNKVGREGGRKGGSEGGRCEVGSGQPHLYKLRVSMAGQNKVGREGGREGDVRWARDSRTCTSST